MTSKIFFRFFLSIIILSCNLLSFSNIRLPKLISDGMVLQRNTKIKIWGWADSNEKITIRFINANYSVTANSKGEWQIILSNLKPGGPYKMEIQGYNQITINDVVVGDVWLCSGQSNMELPMRRVAWIYEDEIANADNQNIRIFTVPQNYDFNNKLNDFKSGSWKSVNSENIMSFPAVSYFFATELYNQYKTPIGIINASLGGSPAEAWISEEALKEFPHYYDELQRFKDSLLIEQITNQDQERSNNWYKLLWQTDEGWKDPANKWISPDLNTNDWSVTKVPGYWAETQPEPVNGVVWFRKKFNVPKSIEGKSALLIMGRIIDADSIFINGVFVGSTGYQYPPRRYQIPAKLLKEGENSIVGTNY